MNKSTNILIVGNGFDLSHYLPTKYDHFMDVMKAIEASRGDSMNFDELFKDCRDEGFIAKTKQYYQTEKVILNQNQVTKIRNLLQENVWYQYFKQHVKNVKTWIDFEQKIERALKLVSKFFTALDHQYTQYGSLLPKIKLMNQIRDNEVVKEICLSELDFNLLTTINLLQKNLSYREFKNISYYSPMGNSNMKSPDMNRGFIAEKWFNVENDPTYGMSKENYIQFLLTNLADFIKVFNLYLDLVVSQLKLKCKAQIFSEDWLKLNRIFSFNYTDTYQRLYDKQIVSEYLHGKSGENQNIVLGVSDLEEEVLRKIKAYGFTKYHQKLFKDTDYLFLDHFKNKIIADKRKLNQLENQKKGEIRSAYLKSIAEEFDKVNKNLKLNVNFYIWGHSLDESDKEYIIDLFSLNDGIDRNVQVIVYYYQDEYFNAKFDLLNNLLHILGKDKVEQWMKNKWLIFKPNPHIEFATTATPLSTDETSCA